MFVCVYCRENIKICGKLKRGNTLMMDGNNGEKTQSWALLGCLLFVFLFMCICLFEKDKS